MPLNPFVILIADRDPVVEVVSARLLSSSLETGVASIHSRVRVMLKPEQVSLLHEPELPLAVRAMQQSVFSAQTEDIEQAQLIVGFSGINGQVLNALRNGGVTAPAINLCQFVLNLGASNSLGTGMSDADVREFMVGAALQYGFTGESGECPICADKVGDSIDYWINIADTCARFAQIIQELQK